MTRSFNGRQRALYQTLGPAREEQEDPVMVGFCVIVVRCPRWTLRSEAVGGQEAARAVPGINGLTRSQTSMRSFSRPAACAF